MASSLIASWDGIANRNGVARAADALLRGAGQVMFQNNPLTGLFFLAGILWAAVASNSIGLFIGAVTGLCVSTLTAALLDVDKQAIRTGLFGFNGILVGIALPTFLAWNGMTILYIVVTAIAVTIVTLAINTVVGTWGLPGSTGPFVFTAWLALLAVYQLRNVTGASLGPTALASQANVNTAFPSDGLTAPNLLHSWLIGVSQVFLLNNIVTAILFVIGIAVSSWRSAVFALAGSAVGLIVALIFGADGNAIYSGLFGYDAVLTAMALGSVFLTANWRTTIYALGGATFATIAAGAMDTWLAPAGVPAFTSAFVLTLWLFLLPKKSSQIVPHAKIAESILGEQN